MAKTPENIAEPAITGPWPPQVDLILSALDTGQHCPTGRRHRRRPYRVIAGLHLFSDAPNAPPWLLYIRDSSARGLGFITPHRLPLGHGGQVELPEPAGLKLFIDCTLSRCRVTAPGWYEGALHFNREQMKFSAD
jgi:hypothetical protein